MRKNLLLAVGACLLLATASAAQARPYSRWRQTLPQDRVTLVDGIVSALRQQNVQVRPKGQSTIASAVAGLPASRTRELQREIGFGLVGTAALSRLDLSVRDLPRRRVSLGESVSNILSQRAREPLGGPRLSASDITQEVKRRPLTPYSRLRAAFYLANQAYTKDSLGATLASPSNWDSYAKKGQRRWSQMATQFDFSTAQLVKVSNYSGRPDDPIDIYLKDGQGRGFRLSNNAFDPIRRDASTPAGYRPVCVEYGAAASDLAQAYGQGRWSHTTTLTMLEPSEMSSMKRIVAGLQRSVAPGSREGQLLARFGQQLSLSKKVMTNYLKGVRY
jgi:hypothetical protein